MSVQVATIIRDQIGAQALSMIGASKLAAGENDLSFKIGRNSKSINYVRISLNGLDLYDMEFIRVRAGKITTVSEANGVYDDMLRPMIEKHTGLYTNL